MSVNSNLYNPTRGSDYMADNTTDKTYVKVSSNEMEAYLYLAVPEDGKDYTIDDLLKLLKENKVVYGIINQSIEDLVKLRAYQREVLVAKGLKAVDGLEGRYEYKFNTNPSGKPMIRQDGTVDYQSAFAVQTVAQNDVIALYSPATFGTKGSTVTGKVLEPKRGKELLPLKGKGFQCLEDKRTYIASITGKIEYQNNRIIITNMLEIKGNLDFNNGKIDFRGDVVIYGDVESASTIKSGGSVTINGNVEATTIIAAKDIILKKGMQGGGKAVIKSGGSIFAKFIEGSHVEAKEDVQADVIMNCSVMAGKDIMITGRKATIIGGNINAAGRIDVVVAGNDAQIKTKLSVGMDEEEKQRIVKIKLAFQVIDQKLKEIDKELGDIQIKQEKAPKFLKEKLKERTKELLRDKIKIISDKAEFKNELKELEEKRIKAKKACISVRKCVYPGVTIKINSAPLFLREKQYAMEYRYEGGEVKWYDLHNNV